MRKEERRGRKVESERSERREGKGERGKGEGVGRRTDNGDEEEERKGERGRVMTGNRTWR